MDSSKHEKEVKSGGVKEEETSGEKRACGEKKR
jgi:hypothetical protein